MVETLCGVHTREKTPVHYTVFRIPRSSLSFVIAAVADSPETPARSRWTYGFHEAPHATAFGNVMLAAMGEKASGGYLDGGGLAKLTDRTITKLSDLDNELQHVRGVGMALEIEEFQRELACLGVPVVGPDGEVTEAVALSVSAEQFGNRRWQLELAARYGAATVSRLLAVSSA